jgi:hypothetical protein
MANCRLVDLILCHTTHEQDEDYRAENFVPRNRTVWIIFYGGPKVRLNSVLVLMSGVRSHRRPTAMRYEVDATLLEDGNDDSTILQHYVISNNSSHLGHFRVIMETFRDDSKRHFWVITGDVSGWY